MALQSSGLIRLSQIQTEFGGSNPISLTEYYRNGSYVTSNNTSVPTTGAIDMTDFYGSVKMFFYTFSANTQEVDLESTLTTAGWNGTDPVTVTVNSGVYLWSDDTSVGGLVISSAFNSLLTVVNNGYIIGRGGNGGNSGSVGQDGGPAIANSATGVVLTNAAGAYIAGGGGGGGGSSDSRTGAGGGGAGGGRGGNSNTRHDTMQGGAGGAVGQAGADGESWGSPYTDDNYSGSDGGTGDPIGFGGGAGGGGGAAIDTGSSSGQYTGAGGGGGRILPGTGGNGGDRSGPFRSAEREGGDGGSGGNVGDNGLASYGLEEGGGGGGGWGAKGGGHLTDARGGAGGAAISGTSISVTNNGTIYGTQA